MGLLQVLRNKFSKKPPLPAPQMTAEEKERVKFRALGVQERESRESTAEAPLAAPSAKVKPTPSEIVILGPHVTEKSSPGRGTGKYIFRVRWGATKGEIRYAIWAQYGIRPTHIAVILMQGKRVRFGRTRGATKRWKKAIVTLPKGKTIDVYGTY